jgi:hypothetical protein
MPPSALVRIACLERFRAGLGQRKRSARNPHRQQEAAAHKSVDPMRQLTAREAYKVRVVEEVLQREIAARAVTSNF